MLHLGAVEQTLSKLRNWCVGLDAPSRLSATICVLPLIVLMATPGPNQVDYDVEYSTAEVVVQWLLFLPSLLVMIPLVGAAQLGLFWFVRRTPQRWLQWMLCFLSAVLLIPYQQFLATTDLTTNSTAPLAAMFYPFYLASLSLPFVGVIWWVARKMAARRRSG
jgi:hypothetical protein